MAAELYKGVLMDPRTGALHCCIVIATNERALLSGSDQPVQNLGRHRIYACKAGKQTFKDRHICSMVYGALLMSATDTN